MVNKKISIHSIVIIVLTGLFAFGGPYLDNPGEVKPDIVAHFHLSGMMQESPDQDAISALEGPVLTLHRILSRIDRAAKDERVKGVIVSISYIGMGMGQLEEIRGALDRCRNAGKKVFVYTEHLGTGLYALLSVATHFSMAPESTLDLTGLYGESLYVKGLLDLLGLQTDFIAAGDYKSAPEMYLRSGPSEKAQENTDWLFDSLYDTIVGQIAESRHLSIAQVKTLIDNGPYSAEQALAAGLCDKIEHFDAFIASVRRQMGPKSMVSNHYGVKAGQAIDFTSPLALLSLFSITIKAPKSPSAVALIYVDGAILPGYQYSNILGQADGAFSGNIRAALENALHDPTIRAVVLRVNSPGGSAEASEVILHAVNMVKKRKPIIVSMGNVAASGGYYVAAEADYIFADEMTITGSIGVFSGKLVTTGLWNKTGLTFVANKRGKNADLYSSSQRFTADQREKLLLQIDAVYETFKRHVVTGRKGKLTKPINEIVGGRVFTGKQALALGLVDEIGGLSAALNHAARAAGLGDVNVRVLPEPKDPLEQIFEALSGQFGDRPSDIAPKGHMAVNGLPGASSLFDTILPQLNKLNPQRMQLVKQCMTRIELLNQNRVIMMMPIDTIIHGL